MINQKDIYVGLNLPSNNELLWARPQSNGSVVLSVKVNNGWVAANSESGSGQYYSKQEIDNRFADILGIDAEGIAALKALVEDGSALTGLLGEINDKLDKDAENIVTGSIKASVPGGYKLTNSSAVGVIMGNTTSTYSALTYNGIEFTNSTGGLSDALTITGNKTDGRVKVGIFASPDLAYKDLAYTNDIPTLLALLSDDTTHRTVTDEDKTMWNYVSNQFKNALIEDHMSGAGITAASFTAEHSGTFLLQGTLSTTGRDITLTFTITRGELYTIVYREVITVTPSDPSATINIEQEVESGDHIGWSTSVYAFDDLHGSITTCQINYIDLSTLASVAMSGSYNDLSNTPSIPDALILSDWNLTDTGMKDYIKNKPTIPAEQVQADWTETSTSSKAYIANKPTIPSYNSATTSQLGLLKVSNKKNSALTLTETAGTTANRYYGVQMDSDGVAFVNVPWEKITFTTASSASINAERNKYYRVTNDVSGNVALTLPNSLLLSGDYVGCSFKTTSGAAGTVSATCTNIDVYKQDGWSSIFSASATFEIIAVYDGNKWMCTFTKFTT